MPTLLQLAQSYSNPDSPEYKIAHILDRIGDTDFGDLAYEDQVQLAMLGETVIVGGFLRTELIAAKSIHAEHLNVDDLSAITGKFSSLIAGTVNGARLEMGESAGDPYLRLYDDDQLRAEFLKDRVKFYGVDVTEMSGTFAGLVAGNPSGARLSIGATLGEPYLYVYDAAGDAGKRVALLKDTLEFWRNGHLGGELFAWFDSTYDASSLNLETDYGISLHADGGGALHEPAGLWLDGLEGLFDAYGSSADLRFNYINMMGVDTNVTVDVFGNFTVHGSKSAAVNTKNYGTRKLYAVESPDNRFCDIIVKTLDTGKHWIDIEPVFAETISDYAVFHSIQGQGYIEILETEPDRFLVQYSGPGEAKIGFLVYGKRKGFEDKRLEGVTEGRIRGRGGGPHGQHRDSRAEN